MVGGTTQSAFNRLTLASPGGVILQNNISINTQLKLTSGTITTGANAVIYAAAAATERFANETGYVIGNLKKNYSAAGAKTFEVGTANGYSPVVASANTGSTFPCALTVSAVQGQHPNFINPANAIARYWRLTEEGNLNASLTFNYLEGDLPATVLESNLFLFRFANGAFTDVQRFHDPDANTMLASNVTEFSDWTIAAPEANNQRAIQGEVTNLFDGVVYPLSGINVDLTGAQAQSRRTDVNGRYYFLVENTGSYTVALSASAFTFTPPSRRSLRHSRELRSPTLPRPACKP